MDASAVSSTRLPVLFLGHGSPMNVIEDNAFRPEWEALGLAFGEGPGARWSRPQLILCISAHWITRGWWLTAMARPPTIHDFGGFPQALFDQQYPAPGAPAVARTLSSELQDPTQGQPLGLDDHAWGLDHGTWSVLKPMFPAADIPVLQLSLDYSRPPAEHYALGRQLRALRARGDCQLVLRSHDELDLTDMVQVDAFFAQNAIDTVYLAAARVGGIHANNTYPAQFIRENLAIAAAVIHAAWKHQVRQLLFLGSSCIYPRLAPQPMREECLLGGALEPTNEPYAVAKIAGIKLCESYNRQFGTDFRCIMPTNLYGPGDNFHAEDSHVLPALVRRFHDALLSGAPEVVIWGSGTPLREFLYVDDLADACLLLMEQPLARLAELVTPQCAHINAGSDSPLSSGALAVMVAEGTTHMLTPSWRRV